MHTNFRSVILRYFFVLILSLWNECENFSYNSSCANNRQIDNSLPKQTLERIIINGEAYWYCLFIAYTVWAVLPLGQHFPYHTINWWQYRVLHEFAAYITSWKISFSNNISNSTCASIWFGVKYKVSPAIDCPQEFLPRMRKVRGWTLNLVISLQCIHWLETWLQIDANYDQNVWKGIEKV